MASPSNQIRSTKTYLWYISDVLGTGATSTVYKGRHKKTGELVAAKAFNSLSFMRPQSVQQREFDVLLKLSHRSIVKLYDIEKDQISKNPVIIMELCAGGSLYNILDDPRNSYGLEEEEFKRVLGDVCAGMKHLRDLDIVHRDIKPGNIMKVTADDGSSIYKLADFGAARELHDDENFMSLYGTEEYLHPDLYERAVLRQPSHKSFSARIDLWSVGITFYHVATGVLPFRPFGGRRNRETMFQITTKKSSGVISAVQRDSMNGPIDWSQELPKTCRLSNGLKGPLTKILRGLLESNPDRMWTFNRLFDQVQALLAMRVIDMFHVSKCQTLKVYMEPNGTLAEFQEQVAEQTGVQATTQILLWERDSFYPDASLKCEYYPRTKPENPVVLMEKGMEEFPLAVMPLQPKLPKISAAYDLEKDAAMAKMCVAVLYYTLAWLQNIACMQELMTTVAKAIVSVLKAEIKQLDYHCVKLKAQVVEVETRLCCIEQSLPAPNVWTGIFKRSPNASMLYTQFKRVEEVIKKMRTKAAMMAKSYIDAETWLTNLRKLLVEDDELTKKWAPTEETYRPCTNCVNRFLVFTEEAHKIFTQFKKDKQMKQLSYNEEQIHKMDKEKLNIKSTQAMSICQSHCEKIWSDIHKALGKWHETVYQYRSQIDSGDRILFGLVRNYQTLLQEVHMLDQDMQPFVTEYSVTLEDCLKISLDTSGHLQRKATEDMATNTDPVMPQSLLYPVNSGDTAKPREPEITPEDIASMTAQLAHLPIDRNGCVLVPKDVKAVFEAWESDVDVLTEQMELGRQQLSAMQQMSLSMLSESTMQSENQLMGACGYQRPRPYESGEDY